MEAKRVRALGIVKQSVLAGLILSTPTLCRAADLAWLDRAGEKVGLTSFQVGIIMFFAVYGLLWLTLVSAYLYRAKLKRARRICAEMEAELATTKDNLGQITQTLENTDSALKAAAHRHASLLNDSAVGIFQMDKAGDCTYVNAKLEELCGLPLKRASQKGLMNAIHEEDRDRVNREWKAFADDGEAFAPMFRFQHDDGTVVSVLCQAHRVESVDHKFEGYLGLVTDVTQLDLECRKQTAGQQRYQHLIEQTAQGFYQLAPEEPISLELPKDELVQAIHTTMKVESCNKVFAKLNGTSVAKLKGMKLKEISGGCGHFVDTGAVAAFVQAGYKSIDAETIRRNSKGDRLNLLNNTIGIIEDNCLVAIWGTQRDISRETRDHESLVSRNEFLQRILASLPGDVEVKDSSCRFLYVSPGVTEKTGVPADKWVGKTVFEILPSTPRDHNNSSVEVMKNGQPGRVIEPCETEDGQGWVETVQTPLFSDDGLIEGVVGLSVDVTERCKTEEDLRKYRVQLEETLEKRSKELEQEIDGHTKTKEDLQQSGAAQEQLKLELKTTVHKFELQIDKHKKAEKQLRNSETALKASKTELEELVARQTLELEKEVDKCNKWEELLGIKEEELNKLSEEVEQHTAYLQEESTRYEKAEEELRQSREELETVRKELEGIDAKYDKKFQREVEKRSKLEALIKERENELIKLGELIEQRNQNIENESGQREQTEGILRRSREELEAARKKLQGIAAKHEQDLGAEIGRRHKIEEQLRKNETALTQANARLKELAAKHANELKRETEARKNAENLLRETKEDLSGHKQNLKVTIEDQARALKREIAERQIREKALRQTEADLKRRLKELEKTVEKRTQELEKQIAAAKIAEAEQEKLIIKLEAVKAEHAEILEQQSAQLNEQITATQEAAEAEQQRLTEELKAVKAQHAEVLKEQAAQLNKEIAETEKTAAAEQQRLKDELEAAKAAHAEALEQQAEELNEQIAEAKDEATALQEREEELLEKQAELEALIAERARELKDQAALRKQAEVSVRQLQKELATLRKQQQVLITRETKALTKEINARKKTEDQMRKRAQDLRKKGENLEKLIRKRTQELEAEVRKHKETENSLKKLQKEFNACHNDIDGLLKLRTKEFKQEISERKKTEEELHQRENELNEKIIELEATIKQRIKEVKKAERDREKTELALIEYVDKYNQYGSEMEEKIAEQDKLHKEAIETRKQAERLLQHSERQYRMLFESSADAFMVIDPETGKVAKANQAAADLFGMDNSDKLLNQTLDTLSPVPQDETAQEEGAGKHVKRVTKKGSDVFEWQYSKADQTAFYALTSLSAVETEDKTRILAVIRDISDMKNRQAELMKAKDNAEAASRTSSSFVNEINDSLQASLNPILNGSAAIKDAPNLSEPQRKQVLDISRSAHNLKEMINYRMELIRIADGTNKVESYQFDLHGFIQRLDDEFCSAAESKRLFFATSHAHNVPQHILADQQKVHQVLAGLLGYAVDNTAKGRLGLHATIEQSSADRDKIAFEVAYTGTVEEDALLTRVFGSAEPQAPQDAAASDVEYSLSLSRQYARIMGGDITLEKRTGNITLLKFEIVCGKVAAPEKPAEEKEPQLAAV